MTDSMPDSPTASTGRIPYTRTQAAGLGFLAGAVIVLLIAGIVTGLDLGEVVSFLVAPAVLLLVGMYLSIRFGLWSKVVGIVLALGAGMMLFWLAFGVTNPASFVDFIAAVMFIVGFLMALIGGIAAVVKRRDLRSEPSSLERQVNLGATAIVALAVVVSVPMWLIGRQTVDAADAEQATPVVMHDFTFQPGELSAASGTTLFLDNRDPFFHTFTVEELGIDIDLLPGDEVLVSLEGAAPGTYVFYCRPHSSPDDPDPEGEDMAGVLVVE